MKRILAILLVLAMLPIPATFALDAEPSAEPIAQEAYDAVTADIWQTIEAIEETEVVAKRGKTAGADSYAAIVDDVIAAVEASDTFVEGSINRNGDFFTWETTEGVVCGYSPRLRARIRANAVEGADAEDYAGVEVTSYATKGGSPSSVDVALIQPYYGIDSSFTTQYVNEAKSIAQATGGTYTLYKTTSATIDNIASAMESSGVVIFDSHGDTDYYTDTGDYTSQANTSYLCLQSGTGLTTADQQSVTGTYGTYYHAYYAGANKSMQYYCVDGTAIANHMDQTAPNSLLWMAICLGMATDGMQKPLRAKGVEVVYGYSQSVTFDGDYQWEAAFWDKMIAGENVATAVSYMKNLYGIKDPYETSYPAYPIVASSEDTYPGQGNVDKAQTVKSTWTLLGSSSGECTHDWKVTQTVAATCTEGGYTLETCSLCSETRKNNITVALGHDMKTDKVVEATCTEGGYTQLKCSRCGVTEKTNTTSALGHNMVAGTVVAATCTQNGYTPYTCSRCSVTEQRNVVPAAGHSYEAVVTEPTYYAQGYTTHTCVNCGDKYVDSYTPALQPAYSITVRVSDEAFGKAFLSGNVVTAVPANGMYVSGFLLTPAYSATVVQEGNRFYITDVKEDCVLTIEFRSKDAAKVTFSVPAGCKAESLTGCVGESVELTAPTGKPVADAHDYVFAGWVETPVSEELSKPDAIFTDSYLFTKQSVTLYALYSYVYRGDTYYTTTVRMDTCLAEQFKDVDTTAWYHEALDFVLEYGYMNGVGEFKFEPNGLLTRAMMVTILYRLDGEGEYAAHPFTDVAKDTWYDEAVAWGYATGVVKGTSATTFSPDDYVTREQAATLLYRYAEYRGEDVSTVGSLMGFEDAKQVSSFARDAMRWAVGEGIINGRSETVLEPLGTATRAEIAKILYGWLS